MSKFGVGDHLGPCGRGVATEDAEISLDFLVDTFCFSIRLRVVSGGEGEIVSEESSEFFGKGGGELRTSIGDDLVIEAEPSVNLVEEKRGNPFGGDGFLRRAENHPLSKPMVYHDQKTVKAVREGKVRDQITGNLLEGAGARGGDWTEQRNGGMCVCFC